MKVAILAIGDEVLSGRTVNTNASYLSKVFESLHYPVVKHHVCMDRLESIVHSLSLLYEHVDLVVTIGGIGPTEDDLTKEAVSKYFKEELVLYPEIVEDIKNYFAHQGAEMPENNIKQAYFINGAKIISNDQGTAPGMIYEKLDKTIIVLPGPPKELVPMVEKEVIPYLQKRQNGWHIKRQYRFMNIGESLLMDRLQSFINNYSSLKIVSYSTDGGIDLIVSTNNKDNTLLFEEACQTLERNMSQYIIGDCKKTIQELVVHRLIEKGYSIGIAESLTGGMLASMIVDVPGSSNIFNEAFVTYSNESKVTRLGVSKESLETKGAVSEEVAVEMAEGVKKTTNATIGISTTGIAGPGGSTSRKPVGLVYIGITMNGKTKVYRHVFSGNRDRVRKKTCDTALFYLYKDFLDE